MRVFKLVNGALMGRDAGTCTEPKSQACKTLRMVSPNRPRSDRRTLAEIDNRAERMTAERANASEPSVVVQGTLGQQLSFRQPLEISKNRGFLSKTACACHFWPARPAARRARQAHERKIRTAALQPRQRRSAQLAAPCRWLHSGESAARAAFVRCGSCATQRGKS